jgi:hypothetical protein
MCILVPHKRFQKFDWADFIKDAHEETTLDAPEPQGHVVQISCFVDADHAAYGQTHI